MGKTTSGILLALMGLTTRDNEDLWRSYRMNKKTLQITILENCKVSKNLKKYVKKTKKKRFQANESFLKAVCE